MAEATERMGGIGVLVNSGGAMSDDMLAHVSTLPSLPSTLMNTSSTLCESRSNHSGQRGLRCPAELHHSAKSASRDDRQGIICGQMPGTVTHSCLQHSLQRRHQPAAIKSLAVRNAMLTAAVCRRVVPIRSSRRLSAWTSWQFTPLSRCGAQAGPSTYLWQPCR